MKFCKTGNVCNDLLIIALVLTPRMGIEGEQSPSSNNFLTVKRKKGSTQQ